MKILILLTLCLFSVGVMHAQKNDYLKVRSKVYSPTCGRQTTEDIQAAIQRLHALDTVGMKNLYAYYEDLGASHWMLMNRDPVHLDSVIMYNLKALTHKPNAPKALWNMAFAYKLRDDCMKVIEYINLYKQHTSTKEWVDDTQINNLLADCKR